MYTDAELSTSQRLSSSSTREEELRESPLQREPRAYISTPEAEAEGWTEREREGGGRGLGRGGRGRGLGGREREREKLELENFIFQGL